MRTPLEQFYPSGHNKKCKREFSLKSLNKSENEGGHVQNNDTQPLVTSQFSKIGKSLPTRIESSQVLL